MGQESWRYCDCLCPGRCGRSDMLEEGGGGSIEAMEGRR